jgi:hypothetical protein
LYFGHRTTSLKNIQIYFCTFVGDIVTSAIMHLAGTVDPKLQFTSTDFNSYNKVATAKIFGAEKCDQVNLILCYHSGLQIRVNFYKVCFVVAVFGLLTFIPKVIYGTRGLFEMGTLSTFKNE